MANEEYILSPSPKLRVHDLFHPHILSTPPINNDGSLLMNCRGVLRGGSGLRGLQPPPPNQSMTGKDWTFSEYVFKWEYVLKWEFLAFSIMFIILFFPKWNVVLCIMSMGEGCNLMYLRQGRQCVTWCSSDEVGDHRPTPHPPPPLRKSWARPCSIGELASSPTIGHELRVAYMQILIG